MSLNKPIKQIVRSSFEAYLSTAITEAPAPRVPTPSTSDVITWIIKANDILSENTGSVAKSFKVCSISNALDGSENALICCAAELPGFTLPYAVAYEDSDKDDIFDTNSSDIADSESNTDEEVEEHCQD